MKRAASMMDNTNQPWTGIRNQWGSTPLPLFLISLGSYSISETVSFMYLRAQRLCETLFSGYIFISFLL